MKTAIYSILALGLMTSSSAMATAQESYNCGPYEVHLYGADDITNVYQTVNGEAVKVMHIESSDLSPLSGRGDNAILVVGDTKIPCKFVDNGN